MKPSFHCLWAMSISLSPLIWRSHRWRCVEMNFESGVKISRTSNGKRVRYRSFIRIGLGIRWKKESYDAKDICLTSFIVSQFPTMRMFANKFQTWCSYFMRIQQLTITRSCHFTKTGLGVNEKKKRFWEEKNEKRKTKKRDGRNTFSV